MALIKIKGHDTPFQVSYEKAKQIKEIWLKAKEKKEGMSLSDVLEIEDWAGTVGDIKEVWVSVRPHENDGAKVVSHCSMCRKEIISPFMELDTARCDNCRGVRSEYKKARIQTRLTN